MYITASIVVYPQQFDVKEKHGKGGEKNTFLLRMP